jgi:hypothetical protein
MEANENSLNFPSSVRGSQPPMESPNFIGNFDDFDQSLDPSLKVEAQPTVRTQSN